LHEKECSALASNLTEKACIAEDIDPDQLALHSDNGSPMKGATLLATLRMLGIAVSFSRPSVSNDNPYSEALFRTAKYLPSYPSGPFASFDAAQRGSKRFVYCYNHPHLHSGIRYVTPAQRHAGEDIAILQRRHAVYLAARDRNPQRWSGNTRNWTPNQAVHLNPEPLTAASEAA
jgi:putative transposase